VADDNALRLKISRSAPGSTVKLTVQRPEGPKQLSVVLGTLKTDSEDEQPGARDMGPGSRSLLEGVSVDELNPQISRQLQLPANTTGVVVTDVRPDSAAAEAGLQRGDVIQQVNRKNVTNINEFEAAVRGDGKSVLLLVNTRGTTRFMVIEPSSR
jgi:serine protease Do